MAVKLVNDVACFGVCLRAKPLFTRFVCARSHSISVLDVSELSVRFSKFSWFLVGGSWPIYTYLLCYRQKSESCWCTAIAVFVFLFRICLFIFYRFCWLDVMLSFSFTIPYEFNFCECPCSRCNVFAYPSNTWYNFLFFFSHDIAVKALLLRC